jgi:hypothetical protein
LSSREDVAEGYTYQVLINYVNHGLTQLFATKTWTFAKTDPRALDDFAVDVPWAFDEWQVGCFVL